MLLLFALFARNMKFLHALDIQNHLQALITNHIPLLFHKKLLHQVPMIEEINKMLHLVLHIYIPFLIIHYIIILYSFHKLKCLKFDQHILLLLFEIDLVH